LSPATYGDCLSAWDIASRTPRARGLGKPPPKVRHPGACSARTVWVRYTSAMNENFGELKARVRKLNELLSAEPDRILGNLEFARAVSQAQRLVRDGDRTREPSQVLRTAVEKAELLGRAIH